ncbi:MAG TPA: hypothetical protein VNQ53_04870 [Nocardioides sp.]|nr:hypothetical protein [Nocardioides sp.]
MTRRPTRRHWLVITAVAFTVIVCGAASGFWSASGDGSGAAETGEAGSVTLGAGVPPSDLFPGGEGDVAVSVTNPNDFPVHIRALELDTSSGTGGFSVEPGHPTCPPDVLTFVAQDNDDAGWTLSANSAGVTLHLGDAVTMDSDAPDACQGAAFRVHLMAAP